MAPYLGDIAEDATIAFCWHTNDSNGASITRATDGAIKVRRLDDGTDCTGTSVTDNEDTPDTGLHECRIDTNDNANYTTGDDYAVWLDGAVIDGQTVNAVLGTFSIENRFMRGTDGANTIVPDAAGVAPTAVENRQEMDSNSTQLSTIAGDVVNIDGIVPATAGDEMNLVDDAITSAKYDEATAFSVKSDDVGASQIARSGADADTLETLSDQIDSTSTHTAANVVTALFAKTGITAGGAVSYEDVIKAVYAMTRGNITRVGDRFTFYDDDGVTVLFTWTIASLSRTT